MTSIALALTLTAAAAEPTCDPPVCFAGQPGIALDDVLLPPRDAVDVPLNATPVVFLVEPGGHIALRVADSTLLVETDLEPLGDRTHLLVPRADLAPDTRYELVFFRDVARSVAILADGVVLSRFTTGHAHDDEAPAAPILAMHPTMERTPCETDGWISARWSGTEEPVIYEIVAQTPSDVEQAIRTEPGLPIGKFMACDTVFAGIDADTPVEVRVRAIDMAGQFGAFSTPEAAAAVDGRGCGCSASGSAPLGILGGLGALLGLLRRRG